jgi:hypothetical protein
LCHGPFLGSTAIGAGVVTRGQLRSAAWRLFTDVYADARLPVDHRLYIRGAALLLLPGGVIAGRSAAHLYGAELAGAGDPVTVAGPRSWRPAHGINVVRRQLSPEDVRLFAGLPVTAPLATGYELARSLPLTEAVEWLDALARVRSLHPVALRGYCDGHAGEPGWRTAARAINLCDPRAESPPESRVRLHLALAGLPAPVPQYPVLHRGEFVARLDLAWPAVRFAIEYDGQWHADPAQLSRDRRRIRELNALGWYVYPVTSADLHDLPGLVVAVRALLSTRGLT